MKWFNPYGLLFVTVILIPNIVFAIKCKDGFENKWQNKFTETMEQIGRFSCFLFMIINVPGTCLGWRSDEVLGVYLIANAVLSGLYCLIWIICFRKSSVFRALALSILPSAMFLLSGITIRSLTLIIAAVIFAPSHILLSYKNAKLS